MRRYSPPLSRFHLVSGLPIPPGTLGGLRRVAEGAAPIRQDERPEPMSRSRVRVYWSHAPWHPSDRTAILSDSWSPARTRRHRPRSPSSPRTRCAGCLPSSVASATAPCFSWPIITGCGPPKCRCSNVRTCTRSKAASTSRGSKAPSPKPIRCNRRTSGSSERICGPARMTHPPSLSPLAVSPWNAARIGT